MNFGQRTRILLLMILIMTTNNYSQNVSSSRSISLAASTAAGENLLSLDWNPSAIIFMNNWEAAFTSDYSFNGSGGSAALRTLALGRRLSEMHYLAAKISPGASLEFVVPSTFKLDDSTQSLQFDKKITFREDAALAYAARLTNTLSLGAGVHIYDEVVSDTKYTTDSNFNIKTSTVDYSGNKATVDVGALWSAGEFWKIGAEAKNLIPIVDRKLDSSVEQYELDIPAVLRVGAAYSGFKNVLLCAEGDTKRNFNIGTEWYAHPLAAVRAGLYIDGATSNDAFALGVGTVLARVRIDLSYLGFFSQENRQGQSDINTFLEANVSNIDFNQFTNNKLSVTASMSFGGPQESFARIEYVSIAKELFPASKMQYALKPIGSARVRNTTTRPIEAKVNFYVDGLMDVPSQTPAQNILPGEVAEVPLYAVFSDEIRSVKTSSVREAEVRVAVSPGSEESDRYQSRVLIRGKNDWNGDAGLLKYFVTPEDQEVLKFTREELSNRKSDLDTVPALRQNFERAEIVFNAFAKRVVYVNDPEQSQDFVQYPSETLSLNGGDCDDFSVCYSSLLASMGISTAFIDVVPPEHPEKAHIYVMFDTGIDAQHAPLISDNPKRYVIRMNERGVETAWIPVETTAIRRGFEEAWNAGAKEYFDDVELNLGVVRGWVKLVDFDAVN